MSEVLTDHPMIIIDSLLKLNIGDKGRIYHLRKSLKEGRVLSESDRKYLNKMKNELIRNKTPVFDKSFYNYHENLISFNGASLEKSQNLVSSFELEINKMKESISNVKYHTERIMDNLELLTINREIMSNKYRDDLTFEEKNRLTRKETKTSWFSWIKKIFFKN